MTQTKLIIEHLLTTQDSSFRKILPLVGIEFGTQLFSPMTHPALSGPLADMVSPVFISAASYDVSVFIISLKLIQRKLLAVQTWGHYSEIKYLTKSELSKAISSQIAKEEYAPIPVTCKQIAMFSKENVVVFSEWSKGIWTTDSPQKMEGIRTKRATAIKIASTLSSHVYKRAKEFSQ